jgi:23S rRNA (pseudouridine1915-N3)-methyltransferase
MKVKIISPANKIPDWINTGCHEYLKRFDDSCKVAFIDIQLNTRSKGSDISRLIEKESKAMLTATAKDDWVVALTIDGKSFSSEGFSKQLENWQSHGQNIVIFIGGPEGLSPECIARADQQISLSGFTLPHPLVRIILVEQLYRAVCISKGHPYHK